MLLLHLLQIKERLAALGKLLRALNQHAPVLWDGQFAVEGGRVFAGLDMHSYIELAVSMATEDAVGGRHIGVVATDGGADMAVMGNEVVGGVEAYPA